MGSQSWHLQKQSPVLVSAQHQAWVGPPSCLGAKLKAPLAHLCPKKLEGGEKPQHCTVTGKEMLPQPQGGGHTDTSGGEGFYVEDFMAIPLPQSLCCLAQGVKLAVRVPQIQSKKGSK